jgi:hypothetical protein
VLEHNWAWQRILTTHGQFTTGFAHLLTWAEETHPIKIYPGVRFRTCLFAADIVSASARSVTEENM